MIYAQNFDFPTVGRPFKKLKNVKANVANRVGEYRQHDVSVSLRSSGDPVFGILCPKEYLDAWKNKPWDEHHRVTIEDGVVIESSFEKVINSLTILSAHYSEFIRTLNMRKIIALRLVLLSPGKISHNPPTFGETRYLVGITSKIGYEVNGQLYECGGFNIDKENPNFDDLHSMNIDGKPVVIDYTDASWETVKAIERTLDGAATLLEKLLDPKTAVLMLAAGNPFAALAAPVQGEDA